MTIQEAIEWIDRRSPNRYTYQEKVRWLSNLEWAVKVELIDTHEWDAAPEFDGYDAGTSPETEMLIPKPYDDVYLYWLESQVDWGNGEMSRYENSRAAFDRRWGDYHSFVNRTQTPKGRNWQYFC